MRFHAPKGVKFIAVVKGASWLSMGGTSAPVKLEQGDAFVVTNGASYVLASAPAVAPVEAHTLPWPTQDGLATYSNGAEVVMIGGGVTLDEAEAGILLDVLPPFLRVHGGSPQARAVGWWIARLGEELAMVQPGTDIAVDHLAHLLFVEFLRTFLRSEEPPFRGWLGALADPRIGRTLHLLHGEPARRWTLQELAEHAGMSRSNFALRYKNLVGVAPLEYLLEWRMRLARKALRGGDRSIAEIAQSLGYESESAFSNAFKRVVGIAPLHYRRRCAEPVANAAS